MVTAADRAGLESDMRRHRAIDAGQRIRNERLEERVRRRPRLTLVHAGLQPGHDVGPPVIARLPEHRPFRWPITPGHERFFVEHRDPYVGRAARFDAEESRCRDAGNRERQVVDRDRAPDDGWVRAEAARPVGVAEDGDVCGVALIFYCNQAS
jgi:hypothetical protein